MAHSSTQSECFSTHSDILEVYEAFEKDPSEQKLNFIMGGKFSEDVKINVDDQQIYNVAYRSEHGKPWVLPVVRHVERDILANDITTDKEYLPVLGYEAFATAVTRLLLGCDSTAIKEDRATSVHCLGGNGAMRLGAEFLVRVAKRTTIYVSDPTWSKYSLLYHVKGAA